MVVQVVRRLVPQRAAVLHRTAAVAAQTAPQAVLHKTAAQAVLHKTAAVAAQTAAQG